MTERHDDKRLFRTLARAHDPVRVLSGYENGIPLLHPPLLSIYAHSPGSRLDVQHMVAIMNVERERSSRLHLDEISADIRPVHADGCRADAATDTLEEPPVRVVHLGPLPLQDIFQMLLFDPLAYRGMEH